MTSGAAIIFGGSGFIGSHLIRALKGSAPERRIISVDIKEPRFKTVGVEYIQWDVRNLSKFRTDADVSQIYNLAAVHTTPGHPTADYYETNILGALEITAFARRNSVHSILFTSSISVYGPGEDTKSENSELAPVSSYGWSKYLAERAHQSWLDEDDARRLVVCRPAVIFGHGESGNFTRLATLLKKGVFVYPGRKDTIKACFYVGDLVESFEYALQTQQRYVLYNGCYPDRYTLEEIVEAFRTGHFPKAKTFVLPKAVMYAAAAGLRPISATGIGIHPDRVIKLVRSTDVVPGWLMEQGIAKAGQLQNALARWQSESPSFQ